MPETARPTETPRGASATSCSVGELRAGDDPDFDVDRRPVEGDVVSATVPDLHLVRDPSRSDLVATPREAAEIRGLFDDLRPVGVEDQERRRACRRTLRRALSHAR